LGIVLEHFTDTLRFYGDALGLKYSANIWAGMSNRHLCPAILLNGAPPGQSLSN
jgi:hypothetical protein